MSSTNKLRIVSDGTAAGTKVFDASGQLLSMISEVKWSVTPDAIAVATITFLNVDLDVVGEQHDC